MSFYNSSFVCCLFGGLIGVACLAVERCLFAGDVVSLVFGCCLLCYLYSL